MHGINVWVPTCDTCNITTTEIAMKAHKNTHTHNKNDANCMHRTNCNKKPSLQNGKWKDRQGTMEIREGGR